MPGLFIVFGRKAIYSDFGTFPGSFEGNGAFAVHPIFRPFKLAGSQPGKEANLQVLVRDNNVDQALRVLKKKMQREGLFREMKTRSAYEKPSEKRTREKAEAIRRQRKLQRKKLQREGLLPAPKKVLRPAR